MGSLGTAGLVSLVLAFAAGAGVVGLLSASVPRTDKRRARCAFVVGVVCGLLAGKALRGRRRGLKTFVAIARGDLRSTRMGLLPGTGRFARALGSAALPARSALAPRRPRRHRM
ncbi:hypothetical protein [Mycolicibacterium pyrenivorans]|uniref:hypothetical protein n=1 Tax=Mycolicibacterium pyrenivorans TaxID=187102 RepID=UPI0021F30A0C|nr:hypothetical protein [Mycolicibacterium pyrenivorans]MCV7151348.1 hypothetical protein [Mycolicibacterium pyrenivorans]